LRVMWLPSVGKTSKGKRTAGKEVTVECFYNGKRLLVTATEWEDSEEE